MSLNAIDVSSFQPANIFNLVPHDAGFVKATEGTGYVSNVCNTQVESLLSAGKLAGVYHFADGNNVSAEVSHFVSNIKGYIGHVVLVLDMEANALRQGPNWAKAFLDGVKSETGVTPWIYGSKGNICIPSYAEVANAGYPLWVAAYGSPRATTYGSHNPGAVGPWGSATAFQYSDSGRFPGYTGSLDLDEVYLSAEQWKTAASVGGKVTAEVPAPAAAPGKLVVDGSLGALTIEAEQRALKVSIDGEEGPQTVSAEQRRTGAGVDGKRGPDTNKHLQSYLNEKISAKLTVDGVRGSATIRALQTALNEDKF